MEKITILVTDDHMLIRDTWCFVLNDHPRFKVVAQCGTAEEAIEKTKELRPDVVIMDINLPGMNGIDATKLIRKYSPGSKILGVSLHSQPAYVKKMMKMGAMGYVTKNSASEEMFKAIEDIHEGKSYICREVKDILTRQLINDEGEPGINSLSSREIEIMSEIKKGNSSKEIAALLFISAKTVEVHRYNILKKLKLRNAASLVNFLNHHPEIEV